MTQEDILTEEQVQYLLHGVLSTKEADPWEDIFPKFCHPSDIVYDEFKLVYPQLDRESYELKVWREAEKYYSRQYLGVVKQKVTELCNRLDIGVTFS